MAAEPTLADLPDAIKGMLRDEANLATARHVLEDARNDCVVREIQLKAQRPKISLFVSKKQRDEYNTAAASLQSQLELIDKILARVGSARERLQGSLRAALLQHLEQADPLYRQGLRAARFHEHWRRSHAMVTDRLTGFLRDLRNASVAVANDSAASRVALTDDATWTVTNLHGASVELDREIAALNHWAAEHAELIKGTPFAASRLPLLEGWGCARRTEPLVKMAPPDALAAIDQTLAEFVEYRQPSLDTLNGMFQAAADEHGQIAEMRLRQCWSELLAYAEAHWVSDAEIEPTLCDIERRLSAAEQARLAAHLPFDPFRTER